MKKIQINAFWTKIKEEIPKENYTIIFNTIKYLNITNELEKSYSGWIFFLERALEKEVFQDNKTFWEKLTRYFGYNPSVYELSQNAIIFQKYK